MTEESDPGVDQYYEHTRDDVQLNLQAFLKSRTLKSPTSAMDIGCASGVFLNKLKETLNLARTCGVEPTDKAEIAAGKLDKVWNTYFTVSLAEEINETFDLIILNDSFEHIYDSEETLAAIGKISHKDTVISFSIPNVRYASNLWHIIGKRDFQYEEAGIRDRTHVRFFTKKSFISLLEDNGFQILDTDADVYALNRSLMTNRSLKGKLFSFIRPVIRFLLWRHKDILEPQFIVICSKQDD